MMANNHPLIISLRRQRTVQKTPEEHDQQLKEELPKNLSRHQYGTLRFLAHNKVTMSYLRVAHANTLGSLAYRGYLIKTGPQDNATVILTKSGEAALRHYEQASLNERSHEGELTDRCERLLKYSARRSVQPIAKTA
jgi:hypothetical protein